MPARAVLVRAAGLAALWWVLTEGRGAGVLALMVIPLALAATFVLARPHVRRVSVLGLLRFLPFFLWESLRGGVDVARRALDPRLALAPATLDLRLRLSDERERVLLAGILSLVPGTVSAELSATHIRLHVLDHRLPIENTVRRVEARIAGVFGESLPASAARRRKRSG